MNNFLKRFIVLCSFAVFPAIAFSATDLTSTATVNVTSDTASNAKIMAFNEARRQITTDVLSKYSDSEKFNELIKNTDDSKLTNLISSTNIDSERLSTTTYSANIKMTIDSSAAKKWLDENGVNNWLGVEDSLPVDKTTVVINITDGLRDWIAFNHAMQTEKIDSEIKRISENEITITIPVTSRSSLISATRNLGWKSSDSEGFLQIWK